MDMPKLPMSEKVRRQVCAAINAHRNRMASDQEYSEKFKQGQDNSCAAVRVLAHERRLARCIRPDVYAQACDV